MKPTLARQRLVEHEIRTPDWYKVGHVVRRGARTGIAQFGARSVPDPAGLAPRTFRSGAQTRLSGTGLHLEDN